MQRISILMLLSFVALGGNFAAAQDDEKPIQKLFKPIKEFRTRHCNPNPVKGCKCAKCKAKRQKKLCERCIEKAKETAEKEKEKLQLVKDLEQLALDLKKLQKEKEAEAKKDNWDSLTEEEKKNPLLEMASAAKADQDLAPKKVQALNYIASLGCSKVADAPKIILAGLKDANADVRGAAVRAILSPYLMPYGSYGGGYLDDVAMQYQVNGVPCALTSTAANCGHCNNRSTRRDTRREKKACDFCKYQTNIDLVIDQLIPDCPKPNCCAENPCNDCQKGRGKARGQSRGKRIKCGFCRGRGCKNCNGKGSIQTSGSCCSSGDCNNITCSEKPPTPPAGVPNMCQCTATDGCQACCTKEIQAELKQIAFGTNDAGCFYEPNENVRHLAAQALELCPGLPPDDVPEEADVTEEPDVSEEDSQDGPTEDLDLNGDENGADSSTYFNGSDRRFVKPVSSRRNYDDESAGPITHTMAVVDSVISDKSIVIQLDGEFMIPENYSIEIETANGTRYEAIVTESTVGQVTIKSTGLPIRVTQGEKLRFGVVAAYSDGI